MSTSYTAFQKQADRGFFPGTTMAAPYTGWSSAAPTEGGAPATPEQIRSQEAWTEGFKEGLVNAVKGDAFRGLARGGLREIADTLDFMQDAPVRTAFITPMLLGRGVTYMTGSNKAENGIRKTRNFLNNILNFGGHQITGGLRGVSNAKLLDPKHLSREAYDQAVLAGRGGVVAADLAISGRLPAKALNILAATQLPDAATQGAASVESVIRETRSAAKERAVHAAHSDLFARKYKPAGPVVEWQPDIQNVSGIPTSVMDAAAIEEIKKDPAVSAEIRKQRIQDYRDVIKYDNAVKQLKQTTKQIGGAGAGGLVGLTAAHQITKRIPVLQKKRILRYLINLLTASGAGYAGWRLFK